MTFPMTFLLLDVRRQVQATLEGGKRV